MRDQPFNKYLPSDKPQSQENYRYPTYQHYYPAKPPKAKDQSSPKKLQVNSEKNLTNT